MSQHHLGLTASTLVESADISLSDTLYPKYVTWHFAKWEHLLVDQTVSTVQTLHTVFCCESRAMPTFQYPDAESRLLKCAALTSKSRE